MVGLCLFNKIFYWFFMIQDGYLTISVHSNSKNNPIFSYIQLIRSQYVNIGSLMPFDEIIRCSKANDEKKKLNNNF